MTNPADSVWIVLNVLVETGGMNMGRGSSASTGCQKALALFKADTTRLLH